MEVGEQDGVKIFKEPDLEERMYLEDNGGIVLEDLKANGRPKEAFSRAPVVRTNVVAVYPGGGRALFESVTFPHHRRTYIPTVGITWRPNSVPTGRYERELNGAVSRAVQSFFDQGGDF